MGIKYKDFLPDARLKIPEARVGDFHIEYGVIHKGEIVHNYYPAGFFHYDKLSTNFPFIKLLQGGKLWMSDSPAEQNQVILPAILAQGEVLVVGLGIGLFVLRVKKFNKTISRLTIVEKHQEVADLVYNYVKNSTTSIVIDDGETYLKSQGKKFDFIYIDVWDSVTAPLSEMELWVDFAQNRLNPGGIVVCWLQELYNRVKSKLPKEPIRSTALFVNTPCIVCGKVLRADYAGLCMDCADTLGVSELFIGK